MGMENSSPGTVTLAHRSSKPSKPIPIPSPRWNFLQMALCWHLVQYFMKRQSCGAQKHGSCKETESSVVQKSTAFGILRLANILPSQQMKIFKYGRQPQGIASQNSRLTQYSTIHLCGLPMAHGFSQGEGIPLYGSGPGNRSVIPGRVTPTGSMLLPLTLLTHSSPPHLKTNMYASGGSQIDKPSPYSTTPMKCAASPSPRMASTSSVEERIRRYHNGQYQSKLCRRILQTKRHQM